MAPGGELEEGERVDCAPEAGDGGGGQARVHARAGESLPRVIPTTKVHFPRNLIETKKLTAEDTEGTETRGELNEQIPGGDRDDGHLVGCGGSLGAGKGGCGLGQGGAGGRGIGPREVEGAR